MPRALSSPIPFTAALRRLDRRVVPSGMTAADWSALGSEVVERSLFSATNIYDSVLEKLKSGVEDLLNPRTEYRPDPETGELKPFTAGKDPATIRAELKQELRKVGYRPGEDERDTIRDLASDARLNLVIDFNTTEAAAYGHHLQALDLELAEAFPCQELVRFEDRNEKRNWWEIWRAHGGVIYPGAGQMGDGREGRMIARKDDPIWAAISAFGRPWAPFAFGSGVGLRDVSREESLALGVIDSGTQITLVRRAFNDNLPAAA